MSAEQYAPRATLEEKVRQALRHWHRPADDDSPLADLYLFRHTQRAQRLTPKQTTNQLLLAALQELQQSHPTEAGILYKRFLDGEKASTLANTLNMVESTVYALQKEGIARLADILMDRENAARLAQRQQMGMRLPSATYARLIGAEPHLAHLQQVIASAEPIWLIALAGLGGIGKTALADALVRRELETGGFDQIGWVTARQLHLNLGGALETVTTPALTTDTLVETLMAQLLDDAQSVDALTPSRQVARLEMYLKAHPHLIVIDNLETAVDVKSLLPLLHRLANPTKFVLTTRQRLYAEPNIYHFTVPALDQSAAFQLLRQEAKIGNLPELATSADQELTPIYQTVGGNPLALRLVVGQAQIHPLPVILEQLTAAQPGASENLYTFIYRQLWQGLDELSRETLLAMPLVSEHGGDLAYLAAVSELSLPDLRLGLTKLVTYNLVDVHGSLHDRRYTIHPLTRSFLHQQVLLWS